MHTLPLYAQNLEIDLHGTFSYTAFWIKNSLHLCTLEMKMEYNMVLILEYAK